MELIMPLEIIGAGFGRTGTNSLKLALEHLGFGPCHHMFEIRDNPDLLPEWQAAARGETLDWGTVFREYRSQVDWPGAVYWRELSAHFPTAKIILSVRGPNGWFDSVQATIAPFVAARGSHDDAHFNAVAHMAHQLVLKRIFDDKLSDREHAIAVFNDHIKNVQATIPAPRLLTFNPTDGWDPLCAFLGVAIPDRPFPKTNSSKEFREDEWNNEEAP
jgi:hypothetical protein